MNIGGDWSVLVGGGGNLKSVVGEDLPFEDSITLLERNLSISGDKMLGGLILIALEVSALLGTAGWN